jgi:SAM-dependent methyltransferase
MKNELTNRQFWLNYWETKTGLVFEVQHNYPFVKLLESLIKVNKSKNLLEIGGFPGYFSVWAKRNLGISATLLDFVIHPKILNDLETANHLKKGDIEVIEADLFNYTSHLKYDLVVSNGLIEHFLDTKDIIQKHVDQLNSGGILLITLPNFKSLNGWFQKTFDIANYEKHNIECMDLDFLNNICKQIGLIDIQTKYSGKFMLWLENESEKPFLVRIFKKIIWLPFKIFFKIVPIDTKAFSPYIIVTAKKP